MYSIHPASPIAAMAMLAAMCHANPAPPAANPTTTLWYEAPADEWQTEALPIGNGRLGAMIFGGVGRERIALNEESVWSGTRVDWNRQGASANLPKIRQLLLAGKNADAEALVNQTFTCTGGGSKGGARGPWGCYQELGNLNLVWKSDAQPLPLNRWKFKLIEVPPDKNIQEQRRQAAARVAEALKPAADTANWNNHQLTDGKPAPGARLLQKDERAVLKHHLKLSAAQHASLGILRIDNGTRNGNVHVNGQDVGPLPAWNDSAYQKFERDVSALLKPGDNEIAVHCSNYRGRGQLPVSVTLERQSHRPPNPRRLRGGPRMARRQTHPSRDPRPSQHRRRCPRPPRQRQHPPGHPQGG